MTSPRQALIQRGIAAQAERAGWEDYSPDYWRYAVYSPDNVILGYRLKRKPNSEKKAKYFWENGKPDNPDSQWYILPSSDKPIQESGTMWLANGEPALLAFLSAGIENAGSTTLSEISFPKQGVSYLLGRGVNRLLYVVDNDIAGYQSAIVWQNGLASSGIDFQAYTWGKQQETRQETDKQGKVSDYIACADIADKADGNDLWISLSFDKQAFQDKLASLSPLALPAPETKRKQAYLANDSDYNEAHSKLSVAVFEALSARGHLTGRRFTSGFYQMTCLYHDEKEASAGFNPETGVINCFRCQKSHGIKENAAALGIRWEDFYPTKEKPKRASTRRVSTQTDTLPIENAETPEYEAMARPFGDMIPMSSYDSPELWISSKKGWIDQDELPAAWIEGMMQLCHAKSMTVIHVIKLHRAFRSGALNSKGFTVADAMRVLESPRLSTQNSIATITEWNLIWILDTNLLVSLDKGTKSIHKSKRGKPPTVYAVNPNTDGVIDSLLSLVEPALLERLTEGELVPAAPSMRDSLELPYEEYKAWGARVNSPRQQHILNTMDRILCNLLESRASFSFTEADLQSPAHLRVRLLTNELAPYSQDRTYTDKATGEVTTIPKGIQLSRHKLALMLGCSDSAMSKLYELGNIGTRRMRGWHEVVNPNDCDMGKELREAPLSLNKELSGVSIAVSMKVYENGQEKFIGLTYGDAIFQRFNQWNGRLVKLYIFVEQPSLLWVMNEAEIEEKRKSDAEALEKELVVADGDELAIAKALKKADKAPRKLSPVTGRDRIAKGHSPAFKADKLGLEVHCFTWHKLEGLAIVDKDSNVLSSCKSLAEVIVWLNRNAETKQVRSVDSYYKPVEVDNEVQQGYTSLVSTPKTEADLGHSSQTVEYADIPKQASKVLTEAKIEYKAYTPNPNITTRFSNVIEKIEKLDKRIAEAEGAK